MHFNHLYELSYLLSLTDFSWRQIRIEILVQPFVQSQSSQRINLPGFLKNKVIYLQSGTSKEGQHNSTYGYISTFKKLLEPLYQNKYRISTKLVPLDLLEPLILIKKHPFLVDKLTILADINKEGVVNGGSLVWRHHREKMVNEADLLMKEKLKHSL